MNLDSRGKNILMLASMIFWTTHCLGKHKREKNTVHEKQSYVWLTALDLLFINHCY